MTFSFKNLKVWQKARVLTVEVYRLTKNFPKSEEFGLTSQIRRAVISVASNLAEGSGRISAKDKAHYTTISYGSLMEVACQLQLAFDIGYIDEYALEAMNKMIEELSKMLICLRRSQLK